MITLDPLAQLEIIKSGTVTLAPVDELIKKLNLNRPLKIKLGADPTAPDLHLGHAVVLCKLKQIQDLGHEVIFLIGDFTARIGDPTGKSKTRPPLSDEQIQKNTTTYLDQVFKILDKNKTKVVFNSKLLSGLSILDVINLAGKVTLSRVIEREDFQNRIKSQTAVGFHELLYPFLQGYDSVALFADLEIGGTDQTFNLMFGRHLQEQFNQSPQIVLTMPILLGLDGQKKMSKSLNNYVGLTDSPEDAFGKLMSMPDSNISNYSRLLLLKTESEVARLEEGLSDGSLHPMIEKKRLSFEITNQFWGIEAASQGQLFFEQLFQNQNYDLAKVVKIEVDEVGSIWIGKLLLQAQIVKTSSEAKRLIENNSVFIDGVLVLDFRANVSVNGGEVLKVGKQVVRLAK